MSDSQAVTLANIREQFKKKLNEENSVTNFIKMVEDKTKVNREYIAYGKQNFYSHKFKLKGTKVG